MITPSGLALLHRACIKAEDNYTIAKANETLDVYTLHSIAASLDEKKQLYTLLLAEFNTSKDRD